MSAERGRISWINPNAPVIGLGSSWTDRLELAAGLLYWGQMNRTQHCLSKTLLKNGFSMEKPASSSSLPPMCLFIADEMDKLLLSGAMNFSLDP